MSIAPICEGDHRYPDVPLPRVEKATLNPRENNIGALRLLLARLVALSHSSELMYGNHSHEILSRLFGKFSFEVLAVDGFFLISGFLITKRWMDKPQIGSPTTFRLNLRAKSSLASSAPKRDFGIMSASLGRLQ